MPCRMWLEFSHSPASHGFNSHRSSKYKSHPINWVAFVFWWSRRESAILASHGACKRHVARGLAACGSPPHSPRVPQVQFLQIVKIQKPPDDAGWLFYFGGVGGNRTRVQKHSTDSSTYLVLPFDLILTTRTHTLRQDELPII